MLLFFILFFYFILVKAMSQFIKLRATQSFKWKAFAKYFASFTGAKSCFFENLFCNYEVPSDFQVIQEGLAGKYEFLCMKHLNFFETFLSLPMKTKLSCFPLKKKERVPHRLVNGGQGTCLKCDRSKFSFHWWIRRCPGLPIAGCYDEKLFLFQS